ncbi:MAG: hypothetical protein ACI9V8_001678 [Urechidicola sp.]|jgi:hypothetical protein
MPDVFNFDLEFNRFSPIDETDGEYAFCWLLKRISGSVDNSDWQSKANIIKQLEYDLP